VSIANTAGAAWLRQPPPKWRFHRLVPAEGKAASLPSLVLRSAIRVSIPPDGPDDRELFYIARDGRLVAVPIRPGSNSEAGEIGAPVPLFVTRAGRWASGLDGPQYVVSTDGLRFLMSTVTGEVTTSPITVILNWKPRP